MKERGACLELEHSAQGAEGWGRAGQEEAGAAGSASGFSTGGRGKMERSTGLQRSPLPAPAALGKSAAT